MHMFLNTYVHIQFDSITSPIASLAIRETPTPHISPEARRERGVVLMGVVNYVKGRIYYVYNMVHGS